MNSKKLSKLQIRAEILLAIQHLISFDEIPRTLQEKYLKNLKSIESREYVLEVFIKELLKYDFKKSKIISIFLIELATFEQLGEVLWSYIKNPAISDELKDVISVILQGIGDTTDPHEYLNYLKNPVETIEKETERLLEISYINPEAQIDLMDFLFSLSMDDQKTLIYSLKEDYPGEYLVNVLLSIIESDPDEELKKVIIELLGESKISVAVPFLQDIYQNSTDLQLKKLAKKSLTSLKLSGVNIDNPEPDTRGMLICSQSKIYECYASAVDGMGNQGLIISRIKPGGDIIMFSTVINDCDGIIDCFGFNALSKYDFSKIVKKFQENSTRILVSPEYCKYKLANAQSLNKKLNLSLPYEYVAWKSLIYDFPELDISLESVAYNSGNIDLISQSDNLYKFPGFKFWFLDDNDGDFIKTSLNNIVNQVIDNKEHFLRNTKALFKWLDDETINLIKEYFSKDVIELFKLRLVDTIYLLDMQELPNFRNITSSVAKALNDGNINIYDIPFFKVLAKKTIYESFVRYQYDLEESKKSTPLNPWSSKKILKEKENNVIIDNSNDLNEIIDMLESDWL